MDNATDFVYVWRLDRSETRVRIWTYTFHDPHSPEEDTRVLRLLCTALLALSLSTPAFAQLASQTGLVGTVTDSGGGVLPGATVTAVNVGTQTTLTGFTNDAGVYQFNAVPLGTYEITISLQGFQTFKATNIRVGGNQVVRQDAVLSVGEFVRDGHGRGGQHDDPDRPRGRVADRRGARRHRPAVERP